MKSQVSSIFCKKGTHSIFRAAAWSFDLISMGSSFFFFFFQETVNNCSSTCRSFSHCSVLSLPNYMYAYSFGSGMVRNAFNAQDADVMQVYNIDSFVYTHKFVLYLQFFTSPLKALPSKEIIFPNYSQWQQALEQNSSSLHMQNQTLASCCQKLLKSSDRNICSLDEGLKVKRKIQHKYLNYVHLGLFLFESTFIRAGFTSRTSTALLTCRPINFPL